ncbi:unnamed protein product [Chrysoparadoxa australica]
MLPFFLIYLLALSEMAVAFHINPLVLTAGMRFAAVHRAKEGEGEEPTPLLPPQDSASSVGGDSWSTADPGASVSLGQIDLNPKLSLSFTCRVCDARSSYKVSRVAYKEGLVICVCSGCRRRHLIADNMGLMDFDDFRHIEEFMAERGDEGDIVKRVSSLTPEGIVLEAVEPDDV